MDEVNKNESWNKTKIFAALFIAVTLVIGGYLFKTRILDGNLTSDSPKSVKGISSKESDDNEKDFNIDIKETVKEKINNLKDEVSNLNVVEIASSSPQVQKILNDIKSLEQYPINQAKEICKQICGL